MKTRLGILFMASIFLIACNQGPCPDRDQIICWNRAYVYFSLVDENNESLIGKDKKYNIDEILDANRATFWEESLVGLQIDNDSIVSLSTYDDELERNLILRMPDSIQFNISNTPLIFKRQFCRN